MLPAVVEMRCDGSVEVCRCKFTFSQKKKLEIFNFMDELKMND